MFRLFLVIFRHQIPRTTVHIVLQYFMSYSTYCNREPFMQSFCDVRVCCGEVAVGYEFLNFLGVLVCVYDGYGISFICFFVLLPCSSLVCLLFFPQSCLPSPLSFLCAWIVVLVVGTVLYQRKNRIKDKLRKNRAIIQKKQIKEIP